jgi:chemotaxis response regulator CheB
VLRVIVIDDHETIRRYAPGWIHGTDIAEVVEVCSDAFSGLKACQRLHPDVVVCDVHMPYADGHEFKEMLQEASLATPVLLFSAHVVDDSHGAEVLHKTASLEELRNALLRAIGELV